MKVSSCVLGGILTLLAVCATSCSTSDLGAPTASNSGKYYAVSVKQAEFYFYGPQQANGPDQKLPQDTLVMLIDRKSTRLNSSHITISYAVFCLKKKKKNIYNSQTNNKRYHE